MAIPEEVMVKVTKRLDAYCDRMPSRLGVETRYAWRVRGNHVSVSEERPNWAGLPGESMVQEVARFRYDPAADHWTLRWRDAKGRLQPFEAPEDLCSFEGLVDGLEAGPVRGGSIA